MKQINLFFISIFLIACSSEADSSLTSSDHVTQSSTSFKDKYSSNGGGEQTSKNIISNRSPDFSINLQTELISTNFSNNINNLFVKVHHCIGARLANSMRAIDNSQSNLLTDNTGLPSISTLAVNDITSSTVSSGGKIMANGKSKIIEKGVVLSTLPHPTIDFQTKTSKGNGGSKFKCNLKNLNSGTTYYVRAYATNCSGTAYGNELKFKTDSTDATTIEVSLIKPPNTIQPLDLFFRLMVVVK